MPETWAVPPRILTDATTPEQSVRKSQLDAEITGHTHPHTHPPAVVTPAYAAAMTLDASTWGPLTDVEITATGALTLTVAGGYDGQRILVLVLASGADRAVTMGTGIGLTTPGPVSPYTVPAGKRGLFAIRCDGGTAAVLVAQTRTA